MASVKEKFQKLARREGGLGFDPLANDEARLATVRLEDIETDPNQPRKDLGDLEELKDSIREHGIIQPLVISPLDDTRYRLIAGERRYTAAQKLGLRTVPCLIRSERDQHRLEIQLIENLHRKGLHPFEEAEGYKRLKNEFSLVDKQIAQRVGRSRSRVTEILSLNQIPEQLREQCRSSDIALETLLQMAKQDTPEQMLEVLQADQAGVPFEERRERARKGKPRQESTTKPKAKFKTPYEAVVIIQSLTLDDMTLERQIASLKEALRQAEDRT